MSYRTKVMQPKHCYVILVLNLYMHLRVSPVQRTSAVSVCCHFFVEFSVKESMGTDPSCSENR